MTYYFSMETVYYNAFAAVQDITRELSHDDIAWFCRTLEAQIGVALNEYPEAKCAIVNFDTDDHDFFIRERASFREFGDDIIFGGPRIDDTRLRRINLCLNSRAADKAFEATRQLFKKHMQEERENAAVGQGAILVAN